MRDVMDYLRRQPVARRCCCNNTDAHDRLERLATPALRVLATRALGRYSPTEVQVGLP